MQAEKCVMVIDENLTLGLIANTSAILGITLGKSLPSVVGQNVVDQSGHEHEGIIEFPVPILKGTAHLIRELRKKLFEDEYQELFVVDFFDVAQGCKTYAEYVEKMKHVPEAQLTYYGIAICGSKKQVNKLTGNLGLLR